LTRIYVKGTGYKVNYEDGKSYTLTINWVLVGRLNLPYHIFRQTDSICILGNILSLLIFCWP
jgi:hypothetical protein